MIWPLKPDPESEDKWRKNEAIRREVHSEQERKRCRILYLVSCRPLRERQHDNTHGGVPA